MTPFPGTAACRSPYSLCEMAITRAIFFPQCSEGMLEVFPLASRTKLRVREQPPQETISLSLSWSSPRAVARHGAIRHTKQANVRLRLT